MKKEYIFNKYKSKFLIKLDNYMIILHLKKYIFLYLQKNEEMRKKRECVHNYLSKFN